MIPRALPALLAAASLLAACGPQSRSASEPDVPRPAGELRADGSVLVDGDIFAVAVNEDRTGALVTASGSGKKKLGQYLRAAEAASGCPADPGGMIAGIPRVHAERVKVTAQDGIRVGLVCPDATTPFADYPQEDRTWLSYDRGHGFQVNYLGSNGQAWLWYPGNTAAVPEIWRVREDGAAVCWLHPTNSWNPVTKQRGGKESCMAIPTMRKITVASLPGDPFDLASGKVPYPLDRCTAPKEFEFDRSAKGC